MPVIRISNQTWDRLKSHARPFEDSPEDIVSLALDALEGVKVGNRSPIEPRHVAERSRRPARGGKLPQREFRQPLLEVLQQLGGRAPVREIRKQLEHSIATRLSDADHEPVSSGDPRWWNAVCWERNDLVKEGILRGDSPRGVWELSQAEERIAAHNLQHPTSRVPGNGRDSHLAGHESSTETLSITWFEDVETGLGQVDNGSGASLQTIYHTVQDIRLSAGRSVPANAEAIIRRTLEENSSDSDSFKGRDVFYMRDGKGAGIWGLRSRQQRTS